MNANTHPVAVEVATRPLTPSEQRLLQIFAAVPEHSHRSFFDLMETICYGCNWKIDASPVQSVTGKPSNVIDAAARFGTTPRTDVIPLFGSQKLTRAEDGRTWLLSSSAESMQACTERESMFINAALRAAGGQ